MRPATRGTSHLVMGRSRASWGWRALAVIAVTASCVTGRRPIAPTARRTEAPAPAVTAPTADASAPIAARDPRGPPQSRRESFRGCGIAVPDDAARESIDMGLRVLLPTDAGQIVGLSVITQRWDSSATVDWDGLARGLRDGIAQRHGVFLYFRAPLVERGLADVAWREHTRVERRERGRMLFDAGRYAVIACATLGEARDEVERAFTTAIESLTLSRSDAPTPGGAPPGARWIGAQGVYAEAPDAWLSQTSSDGSITVVERRREDTPQISLNGGATAGAVAQLIAEARASMVREGATFRSWEVRHTPSGTKVDYEATVVTTEERFFRQNILIEGWRMCVATCAGPETFVVAETSFCGQWLPTVRVER